MEVTMVTAFGKDLFSAPIYADAVSAAKVRKLQNILSRLQCLKLNLIKAKALTRKSCPADAVKAGAAAVKAKETINHSIAEILR